MARDYKPYQGTAVPVGRTQGQIEKMVLEHGGTKTHFFKDHEAQELVFAWERKVVVDGEPKVQPLMHRLSFADLKEAQIYRALYWHLKHKFEAVDFGIVEFVEEFLPYFVVRLPDGDAGTIAEYFVPELRRGALPPMQPMEHKELSAAPADYEVLEDEGVP